MTRNATIPTSTAPIAAVTACVLAPSSAPTRTNTSAMLGHSAPGRTDARRRVAVQYATTMVTDSTTSRRTRAHLVSGAMIATTSDASNSASTRA